MECGRFIDEKVGQSESPEFLRHLATCPGCQGDVEEMDEVRALYRTASNERYPVGVLRPRRFGWGAWVSTAAAAVMLAALVFVMLPRGTTETAGKPAPPQAFFRVHLEPWRGDLRVDRALDDCWRQLDALERSR